MFVQQTNINISVNKQKQTLTVKVMVRQQYMARGFSPSFRWRLSSEHVIPIDDILKELE